MGLLIAKQIRIVVCELNHPSSKMSRMENDIIVRNILPWFPTKSAPTRREKYAIRREKDSPM